MKSMRVGDLVTTPDGEGKIADVEYCNYSGDLCKSEDDYSRVLQVGIKLDSLPEHVAPGDYANDILYYHPREVTALID